MLRLPIKNRRQEKGSAVNDIKSTQTLNYKRSLTDSLQEIEILEGDLSIGCSWISSLNFKLG